MPDVESIRRGLAANLRAALPTDEGMVSHERLASPKAPALLVGDIERMEKLSFGVSRDYRFLIEGIVAMGDSRISSARLDQLIDDVADAVEADGRLTSRLLDTGVVQTGQAAAADGVAFLEYRGVHPEKLDDGTVVIVGVWAVQVIT